MRLLPLSEIIATVMGVESPSTQAVWKSYNALIEKFGNEYSVLIDAPKQALSEVVEPRIADTILRVRTGGVKVVPGFDGVYGRLVLDEHESSDATPETPRHTGTQQLNLQDFL
jgi:PHP family Zn ribbon phosphoesterase